MTYSILRRQEYGNLKTLHLDGSILDVGGSKKSGYQELIRGERSFHIINLDPDCEPDTFVNIEERFPFEDGCFDHAVCLNVLEHIFNFENAFREQVRCVKKGGSIVIATPFMHHIHASPDDYVRLTESTYKKLASKYDCSVVRITPLGYGLFSLLFQTIGGSIPTNLLRNFFRTVSVFLDTFLYKISKRYQILTKRIPLGYFVVLKKES